MIRLTSGRTDHRPWSERLADVAGRLQEHRSMLMVVEFRAQGLRVLEGVRKSATVEPAPYKQGLLKPKQSGTLRQANMGLC